MVLIAPSLLAADFAALGQDCRRVLAGGADWLHVDVMDGHFVPNLALGLPALRGLHRALPQAVYDVHLMLEEPLRYVQAFADAGADWVTIHLEAASCVEQTLRAIHAAGCRAGLALRPGTPAEAALPYLAQLDMLLVMTVEPGFGGQAFLPQQLPKLRALAAAIAASGRDIRLQVDGGINTQTAAACRGAGADVLVAGSAVFGAPDAAAAIAALRGA